MPVRLNIEALANNSPVEVWMNSKKRKLTVNGQTIVLGEYIAVHGPYSEGDDQVVSIVYPKDYAIVMERDIQQILSVRRARAHRLFSSRRLSHVEILDLVFQEGAKVAVSFYDFSEFEGLT